MFQVCRRPRFRGRRDPDVDELQDDEHHHAGGRQECDELVDGAVVTRLGKPAW